MYHSDFAFIVCVCVCVYRDGANFTHTVHLKLNDTILTPAMIFLNSINLCDFVRQTRFVYFKEQTKLLYGTIIYMG
jgi:hypothetical protein